MTGLDTPSSKTSFTESRKDPPWLLSPPRETLAAFEGLPLERNDGLRVMSPDLVFSVPEALAPVEIETTESPAETGTKEALMRVENFENNKINNEKVQA